MSLRPPDLLPHPASALADAGGGADNAPMAFDDELKLLGFQFNQERRDGTRTWSLFTWEFAIGEYMDEYGLQVGANEPLNQFLFPQVDTEVEQNLAAVVAAME